MLRFERERGAGFERWLARLPGSAPVEVASGPDLRIQVTADGGHLVVSERGAGAKAHHRVVAIDGWQTLATYHGDAPTEVGVLEDLVFLLTDGDGSRLLERLDRQGRRRWSLAVLAPTPNRPR